MSNASRRRLERVEAAFSADDLKRICEAPQASFSAYADRVDLPPTRGWRNNILDNFLFYRDNGAPVLFVAHLDHVQRDGTCTVTKTEAGGLLALSGALDDRLGAYIGLEMLPKLGITCDVLLTTNEEQCASSARDFHDYVSHKQYNWMIEFDRGGTDVVLYQYDTPELRDLVEASGAHVGMGSYSDIADLDQLDCAGLNWGVGYEDYHSARSHAWLDDTFKMVSKFLRFHASNASQHLEGDTGWSRVPLGVEDDEGVCPRCDSTLVGADPSWCYSCGWYEEEEGEKRKSS